MHIDGSMFTNLNAGIGKPWAGHIKVIAFNSWWIILLELRLSGNFGLVLPIGSVKNFIEEKEVYENSNPNLNAGIGEPWAGQVSAIEDFDILINVNDFDSSENLGFAPPTGSEKWYQFLAG